MIGSLEEFIGQIDHKLFFSTGRRQLKDRSSHHGLTFHLQQCKTKESSCSKYKIHDGAYPFGLAGNDQTISQTKISGKSLPKQSMLLKIEQHQEKTMPSQTQKISASANEYVASDKSILLNTFQKHIKLIKSKKQEFLAPINDKNISQISTSRDNKNSCYHHIKGKLNHKHQLMRSIVRVEEIDRTNLKTFFQISFERMNEQLNQVRLRQNTKELIFHVDQAYKLGKTDENLPIVSQQETSIAREKGINKKQNKQRQVFRGKPLIYSSRKWSKSTAKSIDKSSRKLHQQSLSNKRSKTLQPSCQSIIKKIKELLVEPKRPWKHIIN